MTPRLRLLAAVGVVAGMVTAVFATGAVSATGTVHAQKPGGIIKMSHFDSPASMSLHEEATAAVNRPMMGVFNNLVMYQQDVQLDRLNRERRRQPVWQIERRLAEDNARPVIFYPRAAWCLQPRVKGMTLMVNSIYNGSRY